MQAEITKVVEEKDTKNTSHKETFHKGVDLSEDFAFRGHIDPKQGW